MKLLFLHFRSLTMNLCPDGSLRWQRFTGVAFGRKQVGMMRDCNLDNQTELAEYNRTRNPERAPESPSAHDEIHELEKTGAMW